MPYGALPPISSLLAPIPRSIFYFDCWFVPLLDEMLREWTALMDLMTARAAGASISLSQVPRQCQETVLELCQPLVPTF